MDAKENFSHIKKIARCLDIWTYLLLPNSHYAFYYSFRKTTPLVGKKGIIWLCNILYAVLSKKEFCLMLKKKCLPSWLCPQKGTPGSSGIRNMKPVGESSLSSILWVPWTTRQDKNSVDLGKSNASYFSMMCHIFFLSFVIFHYQLQNKH